MTNVTNQKTRISGLNCPIDRGAFHRINNSLVERGGDRLSPEVGDRRGWCGEIQLVPFRRNLSCMFSGTKHSRQPSTIRFIIRCFLFFLLSLPCYRPASAQVDQYLGTYSLKYEYKLTIAVVGERIIITEIGQTGNHRYKAVSSFSYKTVQYLRSLRNQNNANNDYQVAIDFTFGSHAEVREYTDDVLERNGSNPRYFSRYADSQTVTRIVNDLTTWIDQQNEQPDSQSDN